MSGTPTRVLILTTDLGARGGVQLVSRLAAGALAPLAANGTRVEVRSLLEGSREPLDVPVWAAHGNRMSFVARGLGDLITAGPTTIVLVLHTHTAPVAIPAALRGARVALCLMGIEVWRPLTPAESWITRRAWRVLAISEHTAARFRASNPSFDGPIAVCPLGVPDVRPSPPASAAPRRALIVSRLAAEEAYKGHDRLIEIWPRIQEKVPDATLTIVGDGDDRTRLQQKVDAAGLRGAIVFAGAVSDENVLSLFEESACYVMPSPHEGFGLTFLEAMRARRPCIAATGAAEEVVADGSTGFIVSADGRDDLADALVQLLGDPARRTAMGDAGRRRYEAMFTVSHFADRLRAALDL